jgi:archaea-specific RecJ-like exonuclease
MEIKMKFLIKSETLDKLEPKFIEAITLIEKSINSKRPVLIRHHADVDGYCGGLAMQRAILSKMYKVHRRESDLFYYFRRLPSKSPYYDYTDVTKDISNFLNEKERFERKTPLVIVIDNGSTAQDLLSLKKLKLYGAKIIVIDHHPNNPGNDEFIDVHVNPFLVGGDSASTAGMICSEIANNMDSSLVTLPLLCALSGVADHSISDMTNQYLKIANQIGLSEGYIRQISECLDFEVHHIGFMESRKFVEDIFFGDIKKQKELVRIIYENLKIQKENFKKIIKHYKETEIVNNMIIAKIDLKKINHRGYPPNGKIVGILSLMVKEKHNLPVFAMGHGSDFITFRISSQLNFDVNKIITALKEKIPYGNIDGGGHAKAGTIRFIPSVKDEIISYLKKNLIK